MSIGRILAVVDGATGSEAVARVSLDLGRRFAAQVEWLSPVPKGARVLPAAPDAMGGAMAGVLLEDEGRSADERRQEVERLLQVYGTEAGVEVLEGDAASEAAGLSLRLHWAEGAISERLAAIGRLSDLILISMREGARLGLAPTVLEQAVLETGRPVLAVPTEALAVPGQAIGLAWDGSREAARAITAALPLFKQAERVAVLTAMLQGLEALPSQVVRYLGAHGVEAQTWGFIPGEQKLGDQLLEQAARAGLDLLVMGAYGHGRMAEVVLGGVTRRILQKAEIAVLLSH